ncbi:hypothetical protein MXD81_09295, partial [Microbacteriaceae bacterium K1510]|nr:hypothetical protein [Microbacteriaceae bacterium K1510]
FYTDREQTEQWQQLAEQGNSAMVPLSSSYRIVSDKPGEAKFLVTAPLTGSLQEGSWPVLYLRKDEKSAWAPATEWVELSSTKAAVPFFPGGDLVIASVAPSFFDVQEASPAYSWVKEPIAALAGVGVIKGISPTQFGLDRTITRTEFVTLLERI